jgi:hypothetical protein
MALRAEADGIAPERALVFEVAGSLGDFYSQAGRIAGLEFLLEDDAELPPDDDFYIMETSKGEKTRSEADIGGRLYMAMPDVRALREILRLWDLHSRGLALPWGFAPWRSLFELLRDLRAWGPADRVLPETVEYWRDRIAARPMEPVRFETELWFHESPDRRRLALDRVAGSVAEAGGRVVSSSVIEPIRFHGMLIELPAQQIAELIQHPDISLGRLDDIMYLRPQSVAVFPEPGLENLEASPVGTVPPPAGDPIAALLDGVPLANHVRLADRIMLDDPEDFAAQSPVAKRAHGTSMASLIIHGDLQAGEEAISRSILVRPVMVYDAQNDVETTPPDRLPLDVIYLAIRRLFDGERSEPATAPGIVLINLSLATPTGRSPAVLVPGPDS